MVAPARAATPVALPPGELAANWRTALELAGLTIGTGRPGVELIIQGERWLVIAWDEDGVARGAELSAPRTQAEREDLARLAASLVRQGTAADVAQSRAVATMPAPVPQPAPSARVAPSARAIRPPAPAPPIESVADTVDGAVGSAGPPPADVVDDATDALVAPKLASKAPEPVALTLAVSALAANRGGLAATAGLRVAAGWARGPAWVELSGSGHQAAGVVGLDAADSLASRGVSLVGGLAREGDINLRLGVGLATTQARFQEHGYPLQVDWTPALALDGSVGLDLIGPVELTLGGQLGLDRRRVQVGLSGASLSEQTTLGRAWLSPAVGLRWSSKLAPVE
jgi:hypothetical protein